MTIDQIKFLLAVTFVMLLAIGFSTTLARVIQLRRRRVALPRLLIRDVILLAGFSFTVLSILIIRAAGITNLGEELWWVLLTSLPPLIALAVYDYFELWVIGRQS